MTLSERIQQLYPEVYIRDSDKIDRLSEMVEKYKQKYATATIESFQRSVRNVITEFELINKADKEKRAKEMFESIYYRDGNNVLDDDNVQLIVEAMIRFEESESTILPTS